MQRPSVALTVDDYNGKGRLITVKEINDKVTHAGKLTLQTIKLNQYHHMKT